MSKIKTIFFDLDETLIENKLSVTEVFGQTFVDFTNELGASNKAAFFSELSKSAKTVWEQMFSVETSPERQIIQCFEDSIAATGAVSNMRQFSLAQEMFEHFLDLTSDNVTFQDNAENMLNDLKSIGFSTGIITNGVEKIQLRKIHKLRVNELVDHVTVSAQARAHKPLSPVFELAVSKARTAPSQCMMVGDHPTNDVAGGIRAGMKGVYYNPKKHDINKAFANLDEKPDHVIESMSELITILWQS